MASYLNNNATTATPEVVKNEIHKWLGCGNASVDPKSKKLLEDAKKYIAKHCHISLNDYEVIFTSCASESNSTIINSVKGLKRKNIITTEIEHNSILKSCSHLDVEVKYVKPNKYGLVSVESIEKLINKNTVLISIMYVNNEVGSINPIADIGLLAKKHNIPFHCDAVQMFGKCRLNIPKLNVDAISMSFHKLYGPPGIGLLVMKKSFSHRRNVNFSPLIAGSQNNDLRGGTENIPYIAGSIAAMKWNFNRRKEKNQYICKLIETIMNHLDKKYKFVNYAEFSKSMLKEHEVIIVYYGYYNKSSQSCNTLLLSIATDRKKMCNMKMKKYLEENKVIVGIGSACNAKSKKASHVLYSLNAPPVLRRGTLRVSLGDYNTAKDVQRFCQVYDKMIKKFVYSD